MSTDLLPHDKRYGAATLTSPPLLPEEAEAQRRAEDVAYTINHALACTATDFIDPYVGHLYQKHFGNTVSIGCGHNHEHEHGEKMRGGSKLWHWWVGEGVGDFGAVPVTIAITRMAPGFTDALRGVIEPVIGPLFRKGAHRSAQKWAMKNDLDVNSDVCKQHEEHIYEHEARHLPQAFLWTVSSIALNLGTQKALGNTAPLPQILMGKVTGAALSAGLLLSGRAIAPQHAHNWDRYTSRTIFIPGTKAIGKWFGIKSETVDRMAAAQEAEENARWSERVSQQPDILEKTR